MHNSEHREFSTVQSVSDTSSQSLRTDIFICCSPEDKSYLEKLKKAFKIYRKDKLNIWDTVSSVQSGLVCQREIEQAFQSARVVVLLTSPDFFASDPIIEHLFPQMLTAAKKKTITIINVILRGFDFESTELAQFQPINDPKCPLSKMRLSERDEIWTKVAKLVRDMVTTQGETTFERLFDQPDTLTTTTHLFFQCRYMQNKKSREQVLSRLSQEICQEIETFPFISQNGSNLDLQEVHHLVKICSSFPDGLERLAYALYQSEHASQPWKELDRHLCKSGAKLATYTRLQELYETLKPIQWPDHIFRRAYRESIPESWEPIHNPDASNKLHPILEDLARILSQNNDTFPILEFVQRLASIAESRQERSLHDTLRKWILERSSDLGLTDSQLAELRKKAEQRRQPSAFYLLLTLDAVSDNTFYIRSWLFNDENNIIQNVNIEMPDESCSLEDIPGLLENLLEKCESYLLDEMENLIIEFSLPLELLSYPVDQYSIRGLNNLQPLGPRHQIVVRSLERMQSKRRQTIWRNKWGLFLDHIKDNQVSSENNSKTLIYQKDHYKGQEAFTATLQDASIACLALPFVPSNISSQANEVLTAILEAGVPIAIWPREQTDHPKALHELLTELVSQHPLSQLPALMKKQRNEAIASGYKRQHQGHHLTLLWDDPNRLPHSRQLAVPSVSRGA